MIHASRMRIDLMGEQPAERVDDQSNPKKRKSWTLREEDVTRHFVRWKIAASSAYPKLIGTARS